MKNGRISEISEKFSSSIRCAELPQFDASFGENWLRWLHRFPSKAARPATIPDPTVTVRGLDVTIAVQDAIVAVQDKYACMLVLQGHCPLVFAPRCMAYGDIWIKKRRLEKLAGYRWVH